MAATKTDPRPFFGTGLLWLAWGAGLVVSGLGMLDLVPEWPVTMATAVFFAFAIAPVLGQFRRDVADRIAATERTGRPPRVWLRSLGLAALSLAMSVYVASRIGNEPPAYHDEYSYLFQAETLATGAFTAPGHPSVAPLFNQFHVLNEGRMASRYFPGTGLWLLPFVTVLHFPLLGHWIAGAISTVFLYRFARELDGEATGVLAGMLLALSPGLAIFSNLLLAHHPTLVGLTLFLWAMLRWYREPRFGWGLLAGSGLAWAMLCRPATAFAMGLPWGIAALTTLWKHRGLDAEQSTRTLIAQRMSSYIGLGLPILIGLGVMGGYNVAVTGRWNHSPYQQYTAIYTPKHVYGFDNAVRGLAQRGPKVLVEYDDWATNLTPGLAVQNGLVRLAASWLWIFDPLAAIVSTVLLLGSFRRWSAEWRWLLASILTLHLVHVPYWYTGIMNWHYVLESALPWTVLIAGVAVRLLRQWKAAGQVGLQAWLVGLGVVLWLGACADFGDGWSSRLTHGIAEIRFSRHAHGEFNRWLERAVPPGPALVLIPAPLTSGHIDYVINSPGLSGRLLRGRYDPARVPLDKIEAAFPDRNIYLCDPKSGTLELLRERSGQAQVN